MLSVPGCLAGVRLEVIICSSQCNLQSGGMPDGLFAYILPGLGNGGGEGGRKVRENVTIGRVR